MKTTKHYRGVSLVEVVIGAGIMATLTVAVFSSYTLMTKYAIANTPFVQATMLAEEGIEAIKIMRDFGWTSNIASLTAGNTYRFAWNGSRFVSTTTASFIDQKFDRTFVISAVNRDASFNIVSSGGTLDTGTKKVTVNVAWKQAGATTTKSIEGYVFNSFGN